MKKFILLFTIFLFIGIGFSYSAPPTRTDNYISGQVANPAAVTRNEDAIFTYLQAGVDVLANNSVTSAKIVDGTIVNADIGSGAAIIGSKLDLSIPGVIGGTTPAAGTFTTLIGTNVDGIVGANTPAAGTFTDLTFTGPTGRVIQVVSVIDSTESSLGTTAFPYDDTIPQKTEGMEVMTLAITPTNASSILVIQVSVNWSINAREKSIIALFQDDTADALNAMATKKSLENAAVDTNTLIHRMVAGTTSSTTFKVRIGPVGSGTIAKNGSDTGSAGLGGVETSSIIITEILP